MKFTRVNVNFPGGVLFLDILNASRLWYNDTTKSIRLYVLRILGSFLKWKNYEAFCNISSLI